MWLPLFGKEKKQGACIETSQLLHAGYWWRKLLAYVCNNPGDAKTLQWLHAFAIQATATTTKTKTPRIAGKLWNNGLLLPSGNLIVFSFKLEQAAPKKEWIKTHKIKGDIFWKDKGTQCRNASTALESNKMIGYVSTTIFSSKRWKWAHFGAGRNWHFGKERREGRQMFINGLLTRMK